MQYLKVRVNIVFLFTFLSGFLLFGLTTVDPAHADIYVAPVLGVGYNTVQQTYYRIGLDVGYSIDENWYAGVGAYYAAGAHPNDDREIGGGPFVGYHYPLASFLSLELREDVDYVDVDDPIALSDGSYTHTSNHGLEFDTYAGVHVSFTRNLGFSVGYRWALGNSHLVDGRSSTVFGITLGI